MRLDRRRRRRRNNTPPPPPDPHVYEKNAAAARNFTRHSGAEQLQQLRSVILMSSSRPTSALKERRPSTALGVTTGHGSESTPNDGKISHDEAGSSLSFNRVNPLHIRPMSALSQASHVSRPGSAMSRSTFTSSRLVMLDSLAEGPGLFQGSYEII